VARLPTGRKWGVCEARVTRIRNLHGWTKATRALTWDRCVLEGNPSLVLEGMIIGAYAIGLQGYIYVRNEYPLR